MGVCKYFCCNLLSWICEDYGGAKEDLHVKFEELRLNNRKEGDQSVLFLLIFTYVYSHSEIICH